MIALHHKAALNGCSSAGIDLQRAFAFIKRSADSKAAAIFDVDLTPVAKCDIAGDIHIAVNIDSVANSGAIESEAAVDVGSVSRIIAITSSQRSVYFCACNLNAAVTCYCNTCTGLDLESLFNCSFAIHSQAAIAGNEQVVIDLKLSVHGSVTSYIKPTSGRKLSASADTHIVQPLSARYTGLAIYGQPTIRSIKGSVGAQFAAGAKLRAINRKAAADGNSAASRESQHTTICNGNAALEVGFAGNREMVAISDSQSKAGGDNKPLAGGNRQISINGAVGRDRDRFVRYSCI